MKGFRKCKNCGESFKKKRLLQSVCSPVCAFEHAKKLKEKKEAREWKERKRKMKEKLTTTSDYKKILQVIINQIVRKIDHDQNCISCGKPPKKENAGHYHSVGANDTIRFNLLNNYLQCEWCNSYLSGNLINYSKQLEELFGEAVYEEIKYTLPREYKELKLSKEDLKEAIKTAKLISSHLELIKRTPKERIKERRRINKALGIYKQKNLPEGGFND